MEDEIRAVMKALERDYGWRFSEEEYANTPARVKAAYDEWGRKHDYDKLTTFPQEERYGGMVIVRNIRVYAECSHHLLPFEGKAHLGYIPGDNIYGLSKLPRIVEKCGYQAQTQERMTREILELIEAKDAIVVIVSKHLCMTMRGIGDEGEEAITSLFKGAFEQQATRDEFLALVGLK
jgi:GTP cyclohydrolase I